MNVQFAVREGRVYVIEANPRASRTVPFVAKATGVPLVRHAVRLMLGRPARRARPAGGGARPRQVAVKEAVLPFARFPGADPVLGPEMRATGEVMGLGGSFAEAFAKAQRGAGQALPRSGSAFISARDADKPRAVALAARLAARRPRPAWPPRGTAAALSAAGLPVRAVRKISEGGRRTSASCIAAGRDRPRGQHAPRRPGRPDRRLRDPRRGDPGRHSRASPRSRRPRRRPPRSRPAGPARPAGPPGRHRRTGPREAPSGRGSQQPQAQPEAEILREPYIRGLACNKREKCVKRLQTSALQSGRTRT